MNYLIFAMGLIVGACAGLLVHALCIEASRNRGLDAELGEAKP